jgi:hypothetical protein
MKRPAVRILVGLVIAAVLTLAPPPAGAAAADRLPDLGMARLQDFSLDTTTIPGHRLLRFTTVIVNIGVGPFETIGSRPNTSTPELAVTQRIFDSAGSSHQISTSAVMFWAGDGHDHWHVRDAEAYELTRVDNGRQVGTGAKEGFCYFDNTAYQPCWPARPATRSMAAAVRQGT